MRLETTISNTAPQALFDAFGGSEFADVFLTSVVGDILGAKQPWLCPAEYSVQMPDRSVGRDPEIWSVELRLTGVSRNGRKVSQFHDALDELLQNAIEVIEGVLGEVDGNPRVQLFCVLMLDGDVETWLGSGAYSPVLERPAVWLTKGGILGADDEDADEGGSTRVGDYESGV